MGINVHGLNFLRYSKKFRNFDKTITIGRQELRASEPVGRNTVVPAYSYKNVKYCEQLLKTYFGSNTVDSVDKSSYEDASIIHDMNQPLPSNLHAIYDTVIDGGCLEHIYNIPQALKNCSVFCKPGAQILHILPANNFCGHGFWQFSPELFFSLYSNANGYQDTEVFLAYSSDTSKWYKVNPPQNGRRVSAFSSIELSVLVRTVLRGVHFSHDNVQQSDYVYEWTKSASNWLDEKNPQNLGQMQKAKKFIRQSPLLFRLLLPLYLRYYRVKSTPGSNLSKLNSDLVELNITSLF